MSSTGSELVFMASYQAATSYIKYRRRNPADVLVLDPALQIFGDYFGTYASCHVVDRSAPARHCLELLQRLSYDSISFWSYALCDLGLEAAHVARRRRIRSRFVLPSSFIDELYACNDLDPGVALREPKSVLQMVLLKLRGYPLTIKTRVNHLYSCIDTRFAESVTTFAELSRHDEYAETQFAAFAAFVRQKYAAVLDDLLSRQKACIVLDEDLGFLHRSTGVRPEEGRRLLLAALDELRRRDFTVYLKPHYEGPPQLSQLHSFAGIIPGEIPMEVVDLILRPDTVVTGFTSSFLSTRTRNLRPIGIARLASEL